MNSKKFTINIEDIKRIREQKIRKKMELYNKIFSKCNLQIWNTIKHNPSISWCLYIIPRYNAGYPLYNIKHCAYYIMSKLRFNMLKTKFYEPNIIFIYWNNNNPYQQIDNIQNRVHSNVPMIKYYKPTGNFL